MSEHLDERLRTAARTYRRLGNQSAESMFLEAADTICKIQAENAKLRELAHLVAEYTSVDQCEGCATKRACNAGELDMCWIRKAILEKLRDLEIEVQP